MNRISRILSSLILVFGIIFLVGCYDENPVSNDTTLDDFDFPTILGVDPVNGASGVDRNSSYIIRFSDSMDTASVTSNCYLSGGSDMRQWMDSVSHMNGMGGMNGMGDPDHDHMMDWMDSISYSGHFEWNNNLDSCVFYPDSMLGPNTEHMLYITGDVRSHDDYRMQMDSLQYDGHTYYFSTGP